MQQLTLQFDGNAQEQQRVDVAAPARKAGQMMNRTAGRARAGAIRLSACARQAICPWHEAWQAWMASRSETFTALCATEQGETFTHDDVVKAHLCMAAVIILIGIGGAL